MDIQKLQLEQISRLSPDEYSDRDDVTLDVTGDVVVPVSWIWFQAKEHNIEEVSIDKLENSLGGRVILDVIINAKRDGEKYLSFLPDCDLCVMNLEDGTNRFYQSECMVHILVNGKKVNDLNFKHKPSHNWYLKSDPRQDHMKGMHGDIAQELDFNKHMLMLVKKYGIKLKKSVVCNDIKDLFS